MNAIERSMYWEVVVRLQGFSPSLNFFPLGTLTAADLSRSSGDGRVYLVESRGSE